MDELESQVYNVLVNLIDENIRVAFEIAEYDGLLIVNEPYIVNYIISQKDNIDNCIAEMIKVYKEDNELHDLLNPRGSWIREFLYEHVNFDSDHKLDLENQ